MVDPPGDRPADPKGATLSPAASQATTAGASSGTDLAGLPPVGGLRDFWKRFRRNKLAVAGLVVIVVLVLSAVFAEWMTKYDPTATNAATGSRLPPSGEHWFGTDITGRDIFARIVFGARISLMVGFLSAAIAVVIGVAAGALAGFYGRWIDALLMRFIDILLAFPYIILAIILALILGRGVKTIILVLGLLGWTTIARVFRSSVLSLKNQEFVEAARALGAGDGRIILRHIIPNAIQPIIVYSTIAVGTAVLTEAALSFLQVGAVDPTPAWGLMLYQNKAQLSTAPWTMLAPMGAILTTVLAFTFVGDGLRDALDPKLR